MFVILSFKIVGGNGFLERPFWLFVGAQGVVDHAHRLGAAADRRFADLWRRHCRGSVYLYPFLTLQKRRPPITLMTQESDTNTMEVWAAMRDALRKLRGMNLWRGHETMLLQQGQVRLMQESRGSRLAHKHFTIYLTPTLESLWAQEFPGGRKISVETDFGGDWEAWLQAIVADCRGASYMHTRSDRAEYRHPKTEAE
jgi:hypothetical protein